MGTRQQLRSKGSAGAPTPGPSTILPRSLAGREGKSPELTFQDKEGTADRR